MPPVAASQSRISHATIEAYLKTEYRVLGKAPFVLTIGIASAPLAALHAASAVSSSAFVTAWYPFSELNDHDAAANDAAQGALIRDIDHRGLTRIDGVGQDPSGNWPGEASVLVLGLGFEEAQALGQRYRQNAVVWCGADAVPQLILLR